MAYRKTTFSKLKLTAAAAATMASIVTSPNIAALGLGSLEVQSNLDQPLNGVIELRVSPGDDLDSVKATIASEEDFANLGIDYPSYLSDINLQIDNVSGTSVLRVLSNDVVIKEPFIHFLVRVDWSGGSFLREYTALIDPPVYAADTPQALAEPRSVGTDQSYQAEQVDSFQAEDLDVEPVVEDISEAEQIDETLQAEVDQTPEVVEEVFNQSPEEQIQEVVEEEPAYQEPVTQEYQEAEPADVDYGDLPTDAQYGPVVAGESLSRIAQELQQQFPDLSIYQIMKVLFEENKGAFIGANINGLLKGSVLNIGDLSAIRAVDVADAKQFFYEQVTEWDPSNLISSSEREDSGLKVGQDTYEYEETFSDDTAGSDAGEATDAFQVGSSTDTQAFSSSTEGATDTGEVLALQQQISDLETSLSSSSLENQELTERISLLEGQLADMNRLMNLQVENAELAGVEAALAEQNVVDEYTDTADPAIGSDAIDAYLEDTADAGLTDDGTVSEYVDEYGLDNLDGSEVDGLDTPLDSAELDMAVGDELVDGALADGSELVADGAEYVDGALAEGSQFAADGSELLADGSEFLADGSELAADTVDELVEEAEAVVAPAVNASKASFMDKMKAAVVDSGLWKIFAGVGGVLLAVGALFFARRRRADEEFEVSMMSIETQSVSVNDEDTEIADGDSKSINRETSFLTVYSDSDAVVQADEVDPIAEADVYIAYGRDEQAEEVLLDGIASKPTRVDIKQKLLALYHKNNNVEGFERIAEELYSQKDQLNSEIWQEVSMMGKDISPDNPLFDVSSAALLADAVVGDNEVAADEAATDEAVAGTEDDDDYEGTDDLDQLAANAENQDDGPDEVTLIADEGDPGELAGGISAPDTFLTVDDASEAVDQALAEEDASINLINFDDGRSEISELDEVEIDALELSVAAQADDADDSNEDDDEEDDEEEAFGANNDYSVEIDVEVAEDASMMTVHIDDEDDEAERKRALEFERLDTNSSSEIRLSIDEEVSDLEIDEDYDEARTQFELAKVFVDLGDEDGAKKILSDIVSNEATEPEVKIEAQELLSSISS